VARVRSTGPIVLLIAASFLAGCGAESPRETGARTAVEEALALADYDASRTRCTDNPAPWFIEKEADVFICAARRLKGGCDWYRATLKNAGWEVVLERENAGCVLSF
jgi:hypothetical protein